MASSPALGFLLACAKAIEDGDLKTADWFLHRIMNVADKELAGYQNIVMKYFADALVRRAHGLHTPPSSHTWLLDLEYFHFHCYHAYGSWNISGITRDTIRNSLALMGKKRFHLIHISLRQSRFGETVLRRLPNSSDDPTSVRVTLLSPFLNEDGHLDYVKKCFHEKAKKLNIKVEEEVKVVCASGLGVVDDFKTREDEATVVFYNVSLSDLLKDTDTATGAMKTELVRLREINPALVFMLDFYANYDDFNFITYLEDSFQFYDNIAEYYDEAFWLPHRQTSEGEDLNPIRRRKTLTKWKDVFLMAGFRQVPLTYSKDEYSEDEEDIEILR